MIYQLVTRVIQYFCFPNRPMKGGDILDFQKGEGILEKRGGEMTSLTNYATEFLTVANSKASSKFLAIFLNQLIVKESPF